MKKITILILLFLTILSCNKKDNKANSIQAINLKYHGLANGYEVTGVFKPLKVNEIDRNIQGVAILTFKKANESFTIIHKLYSINSLYFKSYKEINLENLNVTEIIDTISTEYNDLFKDKTVGTRNFFFSDVNFDNLKDIVLVEKRNGVRTEFDYKFILNTNNFDEISVGNNELVDIPLDNITEVAEFNRESKQIIIPNDGEDYSNGSKIYTIKNINPNTGLPIFYQIK